MSTDDILLEAEMSMEKSVDYMVHEFAAVRTGKASPAQPPAFGHKSLPADGEPLAQATDAGLQADSTLNE